MLSLGLPSCSDGDGEGETMGCPGGIEVIARDFRQLPDCGFILEQLDGKILVIVNFNEFTVPIVDGASYVVIVEQLLTAEAPCMMGQITQLLCIERK